MNAYSQRIQGNFLFIRELSPVLDLHATLAFKVSQDQVSILDAQFLQTTIEAYLAHIRVDDFGWLLT